MGYSYELTLFSKEMCVNITIGIENRYKMARQTYAFSNGVYNDWHRKYDGIAMIDIDSVLSVVLVVMSL